MIKVNDAVKRETVYIVCFCAFLSLLMQVVFTLFKRWDYTVILGNLLSFAVAVLNFYFMGITVQKVVSKDSESAKKIIRSSQSIRNVCVFLAIVVGVAVPCFNTLAVVLPVFFPRIAVSFRPFFKEKEVIDR